MTDLGLDPRDKFQIPDSFEDCETVDLEELRDNMVELFAKNTVSVAKLNSWIAESEAKKGQKEKVVEEEEEKEEDGDRSEKDNLNGKLHVIRRTIKKLEGEIAETEDPDQKAELEKEIQTLRDKGRAIIKEIKQLEKPNENTQKVEEPVEEPKKVEELDNAQKVEEPKKVEED